MILLPSSHFCFFLILSAFLIVNKIKDNIFCLKHPLVYQLLFPYSVLINPNLMQTSWKHITIITFYYIAKVSILLFGMASNCHEGQY